VESGFRQKTRRCQCELVARTERSDIRERLSPLEHKREVAGIGVVEQQACPLVEQVGVDIVRLQQRDSSLPNRTRGFDAVELEGQLRDILVEIPLGDQAMLARIGIDPEIADEQRRDRVERERVEEAAEPSARGP